MGTAVISGAMCRCSFGASPCNLAVASASNTMGCNMAVASVMDNQPANLPSFGMCSSMANPAVSSATAAALGVLTPQPCSPVVAAPWTPGCPTVLVGNKPVLSMNSKAMCMWAGIIEIVNPGQMQVQVP